MKSKLFVGDCLLVMADLAMTSIDAIVTDPPYGLGFMGKDWDKGVPGVEFWTEMLRVAKPGAYLLAFGGSRTSHRMACAIEDAGWEIRDTIMWIYGSGFPKSHNGPWGGTALKPAHEPIIMARKPLVGTVAANVLTYGTGGLNIDGCRVGTEVVSTHSRGSNGAFPKRPGETSAEGSGRKKDQRDGLDHSERTGRWPANVIHDGSEEVLAAFPSSASPWIGNPGTGAKGGTMFGGGEQKTVDKPEYRDAGSAARFFYCAKASKADREEGLDELPAVHRPNGNKWTDTDYRVLSGERDACCESGPRKNTHPTVKPTQLMRYLVRLVTPPGGTVLDPFAGSGSTGKAAVLEWCNFIGIELEAEYAAIAERRIAHAQRSAA